MFYVLKQTLNYHTVFYKKLYITNLILLYFGCFYSVSFIGGFMTVEVRSEIHRVVSSIKPLDEMEKEHIEFVLRWIEGGSEIFRLEKPATPDTHLVSYFVVKDKNKVLLVDHKKAELWLPPGGHVEPGENPKETVRREAKEELGINAEFIYEDPIFLTVTKTVGNVAKHTDVSLWYVLKGNSGDSFVYDEEEFNQISWFRMDEIPFERSDPHMRRFVEKMRGGHGQGSL